MGLADPHSEKSDCTPHALNARIGPRLGPALYSRVLVDEGLVPLLLRPSSVSERARRRLAARVDDEQRDAGEDANHADVLRAGQWRGPAFMLYLDRNGIHDAAVARLVADEIGSDVDDGAHNTPARR